MPPVLSRRHFLAASLAALGTGPVFPTRAETARPRLPLPALIDATNEEPVDLQIRAGHWAFRPGILTPTLGLNQNYLGPTIRTRQHRELNLHYQNRLTEAVAIHGYGLHVPGDVDGGPQLQIAPGDHWQPRLSIVQPAATCWYHAHTHGRTGHQVYHGLAGMILVEDENSDNLDLPRRYGIDDLPVILQDRSFKASGKLVYKPQEAGVEGWLGDTMTLNGAISPFARVPAGHVRLRLLNGSNARFFIVAFADGRSFFEIASDGGLLAAPVPLTAMEMAPGERCEIIVDLSDGKPADLLTLFENELDDPEEGFLGNLQTLLGLTGKSRPQPALTLQVDPALAAHSARLPDKLASIQRPGTAEITRTRDFFLSMEGMEAHDGHRGHGAMNMTINGAAMDMSVINERVTRGVWERWRIRADQGEHPFHVHGCSFLIDKIEGEPSPPDQQGWKDTVVLDDDAWSEILVRFDHPASDAFPYMYHCHILEHEDQGMMGQFTVT